MIDKLTEIKDNLLNFRKERDWEQFHDPKNLAEAISIEAGELLENFLWKKSSDSRNLSEEELQNVKEEASDIFTYLLYLCEEFNIDLYSEVMGKMKKNAIKYPVDKAKGNSNKYNKI